MFDVGFGELVLLFVIGLLVLGPQKLPKVAAEIGKWVGRARRTATQLRRQLEREIELSEIEPPKPPPKPPATPPAAPSAESSAPPASPAAESSAPPVVEPSSAGEAASGHAAPTTVGVADTGGSVEADGAAAEPRDKPTAS